MRRLFPELSVVVLTAALATIASCSYASIGGERRALAVATPTFLHAGFAAGPSLYTDAAGRVIDERRQEPFGAPIEPADLAARDLTPLGQRAEAATGWVDHGARWLAPETARWLTPDPPVDAPSADFMAAPWALHPYQYVDQDPIAFRDPDGREPVPSSSSFTLYVRRYVPSATFGGGFRGDNRGPSADVDASHRTSLNIAFDASTTRIERVWGTSSGVFADGSAARWAVDLSWVLAWDQGARGHVTWAAVPRVRTSATRNAAGVISGASAASDPLLPSFAPDMDTRISFSVVKTRDALFISGYVTGDTYPALDVVVEDSSGRSRLIAADSGSGSLYTSLVGSGRQELAQFRATIPLGPEGRFAGPAQVEQTKAPETSYSMDYFGGM